MITCSFSANFILRRAYRATQGSRNPRSPLSQVLNLEKKRSFQLGHRHQLRSRLDLVRLAHDDNFRMPLPALAERLPQQRLVIHRNHAHGAAFAGIITSPPLRTSSRRPGTAAACCRFPGASPLARHHSRPSPYPPPGSAEPQLGVLRTRTSSNTLRTRPCLPTSPLPTSPSPFKQPKALHSCEHHSSLCVRGTPTRPLPQGRGRAPARPPLRSSPRSRPSRPCLRTSTPLFPAPPTGFNTGPPSYWPRLLFQTQPRTSAFQDADSTLSEASIPFPPP
jgi:hypothetical protein